MFNNLTQSLGRVFQKLRGKGFLSESDIQEAMREVRIALLEADAALPVVKDFIRKVSEKAAGSEVIASVSPAQMIIKIVQDELTALLGAESPELNLRTAPPAVILMAGLQGSGKTTSCAKIAYLLKEKQRKRVLMASLDVYRPAAQEQLAILGVQTGVDTLPVIPEEKPLAITSRALEKARLEAYDVLILDSAGRLHIDDALMQELASVKAASSPVETLLVADALTGQDAVNAARQFHDKIGVTGIVLTRMDGDARGGAALSIKAVTGAPVKFLGVGEKIQDISQFHPDRIAARILDMGDVVSLVEKAAEAVSREDAEKMAKKFRRGEFTLDDLAAQLSTIRKMGGMGGLMNLIPGIGRIKDKIAETSGVDEKIIARQQAIISSMTKQERRFPAVINASRRKRIAAGSGTTVQDINKLLKQFKQMHAMVKKLGGMDKKSLMRSGLAGMLPPIGN